MPVQGVKIETTFVRCILWALLALLASCSSDTSEEVEPDKAENNTFLMFSFTVPKSSDTYENYFDIDRGDYRVYFFAYDPTNEDHERENTELLMRFVPTEIVKEESTSSITYTVKGEVPQSFLNTTAFKVVLLMNWGSYPEVAVGGTTISKLCEDAQGIFSAADKFILDTSNLIPFYGLQEYSGISITEGTTTQLKQSISLLRAVAKVEVVFYSEAEEEEYTPLTDVTLHRYNAQGYCAPANTYLWADYDPDNSSPTVHLVGDRNDTDEKSIPLTMTQERVWGETSQYETWSIYLPEYSNQGTDFYSYLTFTYGDGTETTIYFAPDISLNSNCYDIIRNYLYCFYVYRTDELETRSGRGNGRSHLQISR